MCEIIIYYILIIWKRECAALCVCRTIFSLTLSGEHCLGGKRRRWRRRLPVVLYSFSYSGAGSSTSGTGRSCVYSTWICGAHERSINNFYYAFWFYIYFFFIHSFRILFSFHTKKKISTRNFFFLYVNILFVGNFLKKIYIRPIFI